MELEHPERFVADTPPLQPIIKWNGTIAEILEIITALHAAGKFQKPTGEPMPLTRLVEIIERGLGLKVKGLYERKSNLLARKKDAAPFLRRLISTIESEVEKVYR